MRRRTRGCSTSGCRAEWGAVKSGWGLCTTRVLTSTLCVPRRLNHWLIRTSLTTSPPPTTQGEGHQQPTVHHDRGLGTQTHPIAGSSGWASVAEHPYLAGKAPLGSLTQRDSEGPGGRQPERDRALARRRCKTQRHSRCQPICAVHNVQPHAGGRGGRGWWHQRTGATQCGRAVDTHCGSFLGNVFGPAQTRHRRHHRIQCTCSGGGECQLRCAAACAGCHRHQQKRSNRPPHPWGNEKY